MNRLLILLLLLAVLGVPGVQALEAGAAKVDITPPLGAPLNGYSARLGRGNTGVHDPLWVRCLYLDDGQTRIFWLTADLCVINPELRNRVLELVPPEVPREHVILTATHNHSGTGAMVQGLIFRIFTGRFMPEVLESTAQGFAQAMREAYNGRKRATIGYGTAQQKVLSANRRTPGGPIDEQIGVIRVDDPDGNSIAIVANFAAHPTTVPDELAMEVSADYPGYYYSKLEELSSPGCVAMFTNGAEGNQRCTNPEDKTGWERAESIGRLLAIRVKEAANGIRCGDAVLHLTFAEPALPLSIADSFVRSSTVLQVLEINDLVLTFYPGEPCVELGLEQRRRALERGYKAQFTVALSNDHLFYFAPRELYGRLEYESIMTYYGPGIADWFYTEFGKLMSLGEPAADAPRPPAPKVAAMPNGQSIVLAGTPRDIGYARGAAFRDAIQAAYAEHVLRLVESGEILPESGLWRWLPPFVDPVPLALPRLAVGARPLLAGLNTAAYAELEAMAEGAGLPFDAVWLLQCAPVFAAQPNIEARYRLPMCTMFAALGDRAGADDAIVGRALDWSGAEQAAVVEMRPETGHRFFQIGFAWNTGVYSGMNDSGLVVAMERVEALGVPPVTGAPLEFALRDVLENEDRLKGAVMRLEKLTAMRGYHVLLTDAAGEGAVVEYGDSITVRRAREGLLMGVPPEANTAAPDAVARYARVQTLLKDERIVAPDEVAGVLQDREPGRTGRAQILSEDTKHVVVFEPKHRRMRVAFPDSAGMVTEFQTFSFGERAS